MTGTKTPQGKNDRGLFGKRQATQDMLPTPRPTQTPANAALVMQGKESANEEILPEAFPLQKDVANINNLAVVPPAPRSTYTDKRSAYLEGCFQTLLESLHQTINIRDFSRLSKQEAFEETKVTIKQIAVYKDMILTDQEIVQLSGLIIDEMLGLGPLESLLTRDDVSEVMVNGPKTVYIEVDGRIQRSAITFRDNQHLTAICQRIASQVGRRVDEACPMCDARLPDGSRVNIIIPPLSLDGTTLTIRKFKKEKLTLDRLVEFGSIDPMGAEILKMIAACRVNILVSGGTGSGKTTMLNCLTRYIHMGERIVTCEDSAELQLQQPHVVRLETRPPNLEGVGEVTMRDLVRNCLRMRPERIIVGEVRGAEAFDLLQAMNTGHDGSMGTVHANNPRDAVGRLESMIAMTRLNLPPVTVRQQIASSLNVIVQIQRMRDGSRKVTSITEITGMEGEVVSMQDLLTFEHGGEDHMGRVTGTFRSSGLRPRFSDKLRQYGLEQQFMMLLGRYGKK